jgi:hypothetical protein
MLGFRTKLPLAENPWAVLFDANTKPSPAEQKWCAEQYLMDRTEGGAEKVDRILSFIVAAKPQTDDDSKVTQVTLTPCKLCRDRMRTIAEEDPDPRITKGTEIITVHAEEPRFKKYQKLEDLYKFHKEYVDID